MFRQACAGSKPDEVSPGKKNGPNRCLEDIRLTHWASFRKHRSAFRNHPLRNPQHLEALRRPRRNFPEFLKAPEATRAELPPPETQPKPNPWRRSVRFDDPDTVRGNIACSIPAFRRSLGVTSPRHFPNPPKRIFPASVSNPPSDFSRERPTPKRLESDPLSRWLMSPVHLLGPRQVYLNLPFAKVKNRAIQRCTKSVHLAL